MYPTDRNCRQAAAPPQARRPSHWWIQRQATRCTQTLFDATHNTLRHAAGSLPGLSSDRPPPHGTLATGQPHTVTTHTTPTQGTTRRNTLVATNTAATCHINSNSLEQPATHMLTACSSLCGADRRAACTTSDSVPRRQLGQIDSNCMPLPCWFPTICGCTTGPSKAHHSSHVEHTHWRCMCGPRHTHRCQTRQRG